ncbi:MAG: hypothetical protein ACR2NP_16955 [Pirellulaceae bacterium]
MLALHRLLHQIVDYAGLFPPASLSLDTVARNYHEYVTSQHSWMLARLIIPATRLQEFADIGKALFPDGTRQNRWQISALIPSVSDDSFDEAVASIEAFNQQCDFAQVDTVEGKLSDINVAGASVDRIPASLNAFLEIPHNDPDEIIRELAAMGRSNAFAKIRTGGVTTNLIPSSERVANFICRCAAANLAFKATAGLHHPLSGEYRLTYEADSATGRMHGFINVFLAACFARCHDWTSDHLVTLLETTSPDAFVPGNNQIAFGGLALSAADIETVRQEFAISFGSCSFTEPVEDLIALGWLADAAKTV